MMGRSGLLDDKGIKLLDKSGWVQKERREGRREGVLRKARNGCDLSLALSFYSGTN